MSDDAQPRTFEDWLRRRREREEVRREVQEALELAGGLGWMPPEPTAILAGERDPES